MELICDIHTHIKCSFVMPGFKLIQGPEDVSGGEHLRDFSVKTFFDFSRFVETEHSPR